MKYTTLTKILETTLNELGNDESQFKKAREVGKLANAQIAAWRERRRFYMARDEKPPNGEMDQ
jgi:hypothetical protein